MSDPVTKRCRECGQVKPLDEFHSRVSAPDGHRSDCRDCRTSQERQRYQANREAKLSYQRQYYEANTEAVQGYQRRYRDASRAAVFSHYGRVCACCGTADDLTIDHVNGDGARHRQALYGDSQQGTGADHFYVWLIKQGFPAGYQTLCRPCNASKKGSLACRLDHAKGD